jgi:hypothetical protein
MQINTGISIASLVVSVITLAIVLMLLANKPWESSQVELEMSRGISEAQRLEACALIGHRFSSQPSIGLTAPKVGEMWGAVFENRCTDDEIGWRDQISPR